MTQDAGWQAVRDRPLELVPWALGDGRPRALIGSQRLAVETVRVAYGTPGLATDIQADCLAGPRAWVRTGLGPFIIG